MGYKIVNTMLINSILPYVNLVAGFMVPWMTRSLDNSFSGDIYKTKATSIAQYKKIYSGGEYVIHFKYSGLLNIVFITMMYGVGMPLLFPIAAFNFFNQWLTERYIVAYYMKLPPALDDKLTTNCLNKLKFAPLFLIFNGYWMLSNEQIFDGRWKFIEKASLGMLSTHRVSFTVNWATPVLFMCVAAVIMRATVVILNDKKLRKLGFAMTSKDIEVDEDLPNFFKSIKLS